jgi:hypothetical protein
MIEQAHAWAVASDGMPAGVRDIKFWISICEHLARLAIEEQMTIEQVARVVGCKQCDTLTIGETRLA